MLQALLSAKAYYSGYKPFDVKGETTSARHMETRMAARSGRSPPPDLPSLLLDGRIVYLGMPVSALCAGPAYRQKACICLRWQCSFLIMVLGGNL